MNKGQHDAAIYIGDKVLALSNADGDAFWLAQVHFSNNNYTRALALLSRKDLIHRSLSCRYLASHCYVKQGRYDQALGLLGEENPIHLISDAKHNARRKLAHTNAIGLPIGRHITHRGRSARDRIEYSEERERDREQEKELKFQAGMCYLRGLCWSRRNAFDKAKECFMTAVRIDVQCFEAFDQLMKSSLLSPAEEIKFLNELDFDTIRTDDPTQAQEAAHLTRLLYTTRLSKYASPKTMTEATEDLASHYNLAANPDLLLTRAETLYTQCRFHEALAITTRILNSSTAESSSLENTDPDTLASLGHSPALYPLHLAALYETGSINTLFHLSHTLSINAPHESYTYLAIATYYLSTHRIPLARRFFSKASLLDPHSAPAWIGFAHTFAAEGEHDQAIAAYSTAARLFQGSHLPGLFLGMQHLALNNMSLAWEYCVGAFAMSSGAGSGSKDDADKVTELVFRSPDKVSGDPLVVNELAVILYHQSNLNIAAKLFKRALQLAAELGCDMHAWVAVRANLGHSYRRMSMLDEALAQFDECLRQLTGGSASAQLNGAVASRMVGMNLGMDLTGSSVNVNGPGPIASASAGAAGGYEQRSLLGSIHTSRGLVLLSMMNRTREAVESLHEAVRVLGDAGGGGVAGTLLSKAMEVWSLEEGELSDDEGGNGDDNDDEVPGKENYTDDQILLSGPRKIGRLKNGTGDEGFDVLVGRRLDEDADEMLEGALGGYGYGHR